MTDSLMPWSNMCFNKNSTVSFLKKKKLYIHQDSRKKNQQLSINDRVEKEYSIHSRNSLFHYMTTCIFVIHMEWSSWQLILGKSSIAAENDPVYSILQSAKPTIPLLNTEPSIRSHILKKKKVFFMNQFLNNPPKIGLMFSRPMQYRNVINSLFEGVQKGIIEGVLLHRVHVFPTQSNDITQRLRTVTVEVFTL